MKRIAFTSLFFVSILLLHSCQQSNAPTEADYQYLEEITLQQLQTGYQQGSLTIEKVVADYLKR
ncbi:MAG TPA: hypothetical protein PL167_01150, partial [Cyclobacteriaceae bacterium]|nr:hypothetical protein [Cyclobacteriaceae bacterium]